MAKEFDIYLKNRLTQCDIIVYSIPYRDGLTAANRIILESCLESYALQKFIAEEVGSELTSHIDKMIKVCSERLDIGAGLDTSLEFQTHYVLNPTPAAMYSVAPEPLVILRNILFTVEDAINLGVAPLDARIAKSLGGGSSVVLSDASVRDALKLGILREKAELEIGAEPIVTNAQKKISTAAHIESDAELTMLCYRLYTASEAMMQIAASVLGTEIHFSFGGGASSIELSADVSDESFTKYETVRSAVIAAIDLVEGLIQYFAPVYGGIGITASMDTILKRLRLLSEVDDAALSSLDDMTLEEIDYVIL